MSIEAGRFRHRVRIEKYDYLRDADGEVIQDLQTGETRQEWVEVAEVWAAVEPVSTKEFIQSAATQAQMTARIIVRHRDDIDAAMRLVHVRLNRPDVIYNIAGQPLADKESGLEYLTIPVNTGVGGGHG